MRSCRVEIPSNVLAQHASQVFFADDDVIQAFASHSAKKTLTDRIHPRRTGSDLHDFDIGTFGDSVECRTVLGVAVPDQRLRSLSERRDLPQLLRRPGLGGCASHANVHHALGVHIDDEEGETRAEPECTQSTQ